MIQYEESVVIRRPADRVFAYMQDVNREAEWQPNIQTAEQLTPGAPGVGTQRRYLNAFMGKKIKTVYEFTVFEPNRHVAYQSTSDSDVTAQGEILYESVGRDTKVTMRVAAEIPRLFRFIPKSILLAQAKHELTSMLDRLKRLLEQA